MKVAKFGGSSLANAGRIRKVCDVVASDPKRRIVVVSAPGKGPGEHIKVTDRLIACAERCLAHGSARAELDAVIDRFAGIHRKLGLPPAVMEEITADFSARLKADKRDRARFIDGMKAAGEDNCARLVAAALRSRGKDAHYVNPKKAGLLLSAEYGAARVLEESYTNLRALRKAKGITVFPGFFGATRDGDIVTFPRGGSDITGAVLAAAVKAELYENFTDVDFVFTADPCIVPDARPIPELTYKEMRELAYVGFGVFHDEAIIPAVGAKIPICIKNTRNPEAPGTMVVAKRRIARGQTVAGIGSWGDFCTIFISKYLLDREIGFGRRLFQILEEENLSYEHSPSGIDNMSVILWEKDFDAAAEKHVTTRIRTELGADVSVERGLALIVIVGEGMRHAIGVAARATSALAGASVNIEMINQGSSEISVMFGVKATDRERAVRALYKAFFS